MPVYITGETKMLPAAIGSVICWFLCGWIAGIRKRLWLTILSCAVAIIFGLIVFPFVTAGILSAAGAHAAQVFVGSVSWSILVIFVGIWSAIRSHRRPRIRAAEGYKRDKFSPF